MKIEYLIPGMIHIQADAFRDERGMFLETFQKNRYAKAGIRKNFVQDNLSLSRRGVLRGLHCQRSHSQGKLEFRAFEPALQNRPHFLVWERQGEK
jgi:dTDP-4-dehydrorhamnose 3,5-epimerase